MRPIGIQIIVGIVGVGSILAAAQATSSAAVVSDSPSPSIEEVKPVSQAQGFAGADLKPDAEPATPSTKIAKATPPVPADIPEVTIDPASLLPDLPKVPVAKASLIGGTIGRLDRVRDQIIVQVFGGGKMKISFDPRTHIYNDGREASLADLRQGDRVYIETILDGSNVFARAIRLKTSTSAGESQGIITSYRADRGELLVRDALSPRSVKIRVSSQTKITEGDHSAPVSKLVPGTLVAIKFDAHQDGGELAREISVLASAGATFTFVGQVTAIDLRLGLLALTSSTDHKTYEIYLDPSQPVVDDNLRPNTSVTVLTRFEGSKYVARSITVNSPSQ